MNENLPKRFVVSVKEVGQERRIKERSWARGADPSNGADGYGYTPEIDSVECFQREIYRRELNDLDLKALVATVNAISVKPQEAA